MDCKSWGFRHVFGPAAEVEGTTLLKECPSKAVVSGIMVSGLMQAADKPRLWFWLAVALVVTNSVTAKSNDASASGNPAELVSRAVQNEIAANSPSGMHFMFRNQRKTPHTNQTKLIVETSEATAGMLVEVDGHPLTPQQRQAEEARLQNYIHNPEELNRKRRQEKEDSERTERIMKALPNAFLYKRIGTEQGTVGIGSPADELVRLNFRPNPNYEPPSHVEQVLTGMQGHLLVDAKQNRIAEIDGTLEKDVSFGWGFLGHLDRGGRFLVQQADVGNHEWQMTHMELAFTGKVLFVKKLNIRSTDSFSDFHPVGRDLTFAQGVALLEKEAGRKQSQASAPKHDQAESKLQRKSGTNQESSKPSAVTTRQASTGISRPG